MEWRAVKASRVLKTLLSLGWKIKRQRGSHRVLGKAGLSDFTFAFHDREEIGPRMLARTDKPITLRSTGEEVPGLKGSRFAPAAGFVLGALDLTPAGKARRAATQAALKQAQKVRPSRVTTRPPLPEGVGLRESLPRHLPKDVSLPSSIPQTGINLKRFKGREKSPYKYLTYYISSDTYHEGSDPLDFKWRRIDI